MTCQRIGRLPTWIIGFGATSAGSRMRRPWARKKITTFTAAPPVDVLSSDLPASLTSWDQRLTARVSHTLPGSGLESDRLGANQGDGQGAAALRGEEPGRG